MINKEKQLLEKFSKYSKEELEDRVNELPDENECSTEFNTSIMNLIHDITMKDVELPQVDFEDALQEWFDRQTKEDQEAFLNEDWSEFNDL